MGKTRRKKDEWLEALFAPVEPEQLSTALRLFERMDPEDRGDLGARALEIIKHFHKPGGASPDFRAADLAAAIDFRMRALASLRHRPEMAAWVLPSGEDDHDYINGALIAAAAVEPIVKVGNSDVTFDPESFFKRVLGISDIDGEA